MHPTPRFISQKANATVNNFAGNVTETITSSYDINIPTHFSSAVPKIPSGSTAMPLSSDEENGQRIKIVDLPEHFYVQTKFMSAPGAKKYNLFDNKKRSEQNVQISNNCNSNNTPQIGINVTPGLPKTITSTTSNAATTSTIVQRSGIIIRPLGLTCNNNINPNSPTNVLPYNTATMSTNITTPIGPLNVHVPFNNVNTSQTLLRTLLSCNSIVGPPPIANNRQIDMAANTFTVQSSRPVISASSGLTTQCVTALKKDAETMTDRNAAIIDRYQQTDSIMPSTATIAIQCNRYKENDNENPNNDVEVIEDVAVVEENLSHAMQTHIQNDEASDMENTFRQFLISSSYQYNNGLRECLICGEIMKWDKHFMAHMSVHWGPKVLCFTCGQLLQHETLLKKHCCTPCHYHATKKKSISQLFRCPYYRCGVVAISPIELHDHINEHSNLKTFTCKQCSKLFRTYDELSQHKYLHAKCYTKAVNVKRSKKLLYGRYSKNCRKYRNHVYPIYNLTGGKILVRKSLKRKDCTCQICLRGGYRNRSALKRHMSKCLKWYKKRLAFKTLKCLREF